MIAIVENIPLLAIITAVIVLLIKIFLTCWTCNQNDFSDRKQQKSLSTVPGPWGLPLVGYFPFMSRRVNLSLTNLWRCYGDVYRIQIGSRQVVVLNGFDTIRQAFVEKSTDFAGRPDFYTYQVASKGSLIGLNDYSPQYRTAKKVLLKSFGNFLNEKQTELQLVAHKAVEQLIGVIKSFKGQPFDPHPYLYPIICTIMGYVCWGDFFDVDDERVKHVLGNAQEFGNAMAFGVACDYFPCMKRFFVGKLTKLERLMEANKSYSSKLASVHVDTYDGSRMRDITDFFHKASDEMDEERKTILNLSKQDLLSIPGGMFGAGFGTIAITTKWAMLLLAKYPKYQKKMQVEIDRVVGINRYPCFDDVEDLPYTMAVISEIYRYSSIAHIAFAHRATCDTKVNEYLIPKNTTVVANFYSLHRDPRNFVEPGIFNPDRFIDQNTGQLNRALLEKVCPYGLGARRCGGEIIARLEIFTFVTTLVQKCNIFESPDHPIDPENYKSRLALDPNSFKVLFTSRFSEW